MLSWPSLEVLQALILIAWAEFGCGRDSGESSCLVSYKGAYSLLTYIGLWMYSRVSNIPSVVLVGTSSGLIDGGVYGYGSPTRKRDYHPSGS